MAPNFNFTWIAQFRRSFAFSVPSTQPYIRIYASCNHTLYEILFRGRSVTMKFFLSSHITFGRILYIQTYNIRISYYIFSDFFCFSLYVIQLIDCWLISSYLFFSNIGHTSFYCAFVHVSMFFFLFQFRISSIETQFKWFQTILSFGHFLVLLIFFFSFMFLFYFRCYLFFLYFSCFKNKKKLFLLDFIPIFWSEWTWLLHTHFYKNVDNQKRKKNLYVGFFWQEFISSVSSKLKFQILPTK